MTPDHTGGELFGAVAAGLVACRVEGVAPAGPARRPGVLGVADLEPPTRRSLEPEAARRAVAGAVTAALGAESAVAAVKALFGPADTVGIKLSCLAGANLSPRPELVEALADLLAEAGVRRDRIIVFERSSRELERAGLRDPPVGRRALPVLRGRQRLGAAAHRPRGRSARASPGW